MALTNSLYRVKIDNVYSSNAVATSIRNSINSALSDAGRSEVADGTGTNVTLLVVGLTETEAVDLRAALKAAWTGSARTYGKVAVTRSNDLD